MSFQLPTLADVQAARAGKPHMKPELRKRTKARKDRHEAAVKKAVRAACVKRDGLCRMCQTNAFRTGIRDVCPTIFWIGFRDMGPSEWAHMHQKRRSQTRGQDPEVRHTTADSLMLCTRHHDQYDGRAKPRLFITRLTRKGADGPLKFRRGKA